MALRMDKHKLTSVVEPGKGGVGAMEWGQILFCKYCSAGEAGITVRGCLTGCKPGQGEHGAVLAGLVAGSSAAVGHRRTGAAHAGSPQNEAHSAGMLIMLV